MVENLAPYAQGKNEKIKGKKIKNKKTHQRCEYFGGLGRT